MAGPLQITFAEWVTAAEMEVAINLIQTFGVTMHQDRQLRTLTIMPNPAELETLQEYLAVWEIDQALSWSDAT